MNRWPTRWAVFAMILVALAGYAAAATLEVDDDGTTPFQSIQSAIQAASPGVDDVFVHCGTYQENVVMVDGVSVRGAGAQCAVIDGGQNGSVVSMDGIGSGTVLRGFTIRNGRAELGGGIFVEDGSPTITENVITDNTAFGPGPFTGNGGGILVQGPVASKAATAPVISRNIIKNNRAEFAGGGMEIDADALPTVTNNLFDGNTAMELGGAIDIFGNSFATIVNNTIVRNCVQGTETACSQGGGAISITNSGAQFDNNVIAWNEAAVGGGVDVSNSTVTFASNDTFGNQPVDYQGVRDPTGSDGNISVDPLFVDAYAAPGGFQPRSDSPLIDAGATASAPTDDLRGLPRPLDGDAEGTALPDIGARENEGVTRLRFTGPADPVWDPSVGAFALFNLYRGDLQVLRDTLVYTQDPMTVLGARQWCALGMPLVADSDLPSPGQVLFYLAVIDNGIEGTLGFDSTPLERPYTESNRCP